MMKMSRKALIFMAATLALATAATAATAFAGTTRKFPSAEQEVADAVRSAANAAQHAKVRKLPIVQANNAGGIKVAFPRR